MKPRYSILSFALLLLLAGLLVIPAGAAGSSGYIEVGLQPVADFAVYYPTNSVPMTVTFYDQSGGSAPMTWHWDFGDGATSDEQNPRHNYISTGPYTVTLTVTNAYGTDTQVKRDVVSLGLAPRADFTAAPTDGTVPLPVLFADRSSANPTAWFWEFGDGTTSTQQNPLHVYQAGAKYSVTLTVSNAYGSSTTTKSGIINAAKSLKANYIAAPMTGKVPLTVQFTDTSRGGPVSWAWDFGDGTKSPDQNPVHTFSTTGIYNVVLTVTGAEGSDSATQAINAGGVPAAAFSADKTIAGVNENIRFTDLSTNAPTQWTWDFGDGVTVTDQNPVHQYLDKGIYTVTLTAKNDNGKNSAVKKDYINVGLAPIADFYSDTQTVGVPGEVRFIDRSVRNPTSWAWEFGDGSVSTDENPSHVYQSIGTYTVTLTAKNSIGSSTKVSRDYINAGLGPTADFSANPQTGTVGTFVRFIDQSRNAPNEWLWEFGDGLSSTEQNPVHQYQRAGVFRVTLTVANSYSWSRAMKNDYITITGPEKAVSATPTPAQNLKPVADFTVDQRVGKAPFIVKFRDLSRNNPVKWAWDFGDGGTSVEQNPVHVYKYEGVYNVTLVATNQYGSDTRYSTGATRPEAVTTVLTTSVLTPVQTAPASMPAATTAATPAATPVPLSASCVILALGAAGALVVLVKRTR